MSKKRLFFDISNYHEHNFNSGIQRVLKELLSRLLTDVSFDEYEVLTIQFNASTHQLDIFNESYIIGFMSGKETDGTNRVNSSINLTDIEEGDIFFDIDAAWNSPLKRTFLYELLKKNNVTIFNYIYDLAPILFPGLAHENTLRNFVTYIAAVYKYSDLVFLDSRSSEVEFHKLAQEIKTERYVPTIVTKLGADFMGNVISDTNPETERSSLHLEALSTKYILFVGTIEPRKEQKLVFESFLKLNKKHPDLNLVFIGRKGWLSDELTEDIKGSRLFNEKMFWFTDVDDTLLNEFYEKAFIVTYISRHEGFGLPIAESLIHGNITITSKNSSMYEVGKDFADYLLFNSKKELVDIIDSYCSDETLYSAKKSFITKYFKPYKWDTVYANFATTIKKYSFAENLRKENTYARNSKLQFVFISINANNLQKTLSSLDKRVNFVKEYVVITSKNLVSRVRKLKTNNKLVVVNEEELLADKVNQFRNADHVQKNWMLRSRLAELNIVDDEFIMLDDDNMPLTSVDKSFFVSEEGRYIGYYFYDLIHWAHLSADYDYGQHFNGRVLDNKVYELLSYSSHAPQIINKSLFTEMVKDFSDVSEKTPIDEWSTYFNYVATKYPSVLEKRVYETMLWYSDIQNWDRDARYEPPKYTFENYYSKLYSSGGLYGGVLDEDDSESKISIVKDKVRSLNESRKLQSQSSQLSAEKDMVHGIIKFTHDHGVVYVSSIPYLIAMKSHSISRIRVTYKSILFGKKIPKLTFYYTIKNQTSTVEVELEPYEKHRRKYDERVVVLPIASGEPGTYNIHFDIRVDEVELNKNNTSSYYSKLIVCDEGESLEDALLNNKQTKK